MKKVFATLALLFVMSAMTFTPKTAQADEAPCVILIYCGHSALTCELDDFLFWYSHFCGDSTED